jgi:ubiquinone/menaquinone biosynthesis C-methylase UbiE
VIKPNRGAETYVLGHSDRELERLRRQAQLIDPITLQFLTEAGIANGMRVLDVGSGAGDVAFLAANLVGRAGQVVGVDRSAAALSRARTRAEERSLVNVTFRESELSAIAFDQRFDAAIGRYVLCFQADPVSLVRSIANLVRPGGSSCSTSRIASRRSRSRRCLLMIARTNGSVRHIVSPVWM